MKLKHKLILAVLSAILLAGFVNVPNTPIGTTVSAATSTKLAAPTGVKTTKTDNSVKLSWDAVSDAGGYRVYMYNASTKKYEKYKDVISTTCTIKGLEAATTYKFKVASLKFSTKSSSKTISKKTSSTGTSVKLTWSAVKGAGGYRVYKYNSSTQKYVKYKDVVGTSCTVTGLKASTTYKFKITPLTFTKQGTTSAISAKTNAGSSSTNNSTTPVSPVSDFEYKYVSELGGIEITKYKGKAYSVANIPSKIEGKSVVSIGKDAFRYSWVAEVIIPDSVKTIGSHAFDQCAKLTKINIPYGITTIEASTFYYCESLTSLTIPSGVTSIGDNAFSMCESLKSITIPNSVTSIGIKAFYNCTSLESLNIPDSVTSIGDYAFSYCDKATFTYKGTTYSYSEREKLYKAINDPSSSSSSSDSSSSEPTNTVDVPDSSTVSDSEFTTAFDDKFGGTMITSYTGTAEVVEFPETINGTTIGMLSNKGSFEDYTPKCAYPSIKTAIIPDSISQIDGYTFYNCTNLTSVTFGENVYWVSKEAFSGCTNLTDVAINDSIYHIDSDAFKDCTKLNNVTYKGKTYTYATINELIKAING